LVDGLTAADKVAAAIDRAADAWEAGHTPSSIYTRDADDLRRIAKIVRLGKARLAHTTARALDTIVRDQLPKTFWTWLEKNGEIP